MRMPTTKDFTCAWLSRHTPTTHQVASLRAYDIVQVSPDRRFSGPRDAWDTALRACEQQPDLFVVVLPNAWEKDFVALAQQLAPTTPILQARMLPPTYRYWSGTWRALSIGHNGELTWRVWRPETTGQ